MSLVLLKVSCCCSVQTEYFLEFFQESCIYFSCCYSLPLRFCKTPGDNVVCNRHCTNKAKLN